MEALRQYVFSIVAASMISGVVMGFLQGGTVKELLKLICGLFLAFMIISPLHQLDLSDFAIPGETEKQTGQDIAAEGKELAEEAIADIIKAETEAYILDKAAQLNVELEVEVTVSMDDPPLPMAVSLSGSISPYARRRLEAILTDEIGIPKENQAWTG
ncbi:MAG: hypothetical protein IJ001_06585 [Oscillospiraceae bacterium]|nr:hypothetical protein [Oscillospiraceae bacterium]